MLILDVVAIILIRESESHTEALNVHFVVSVVVSGCFSPLMYIHLMRMVVEDKMFESEALIDSMTVCSRPASVRSDLPGSFVSQMGICCEGYFRGRRRRSSDG